MPITLACPSCHQHCAVKDEYAGMQVRCPHCPTVMTVPLPMATPIFAPATPPVTPSAPTPAPLPDWLTDKRLWLGGGQLIGSVVAFVFCIWLVLRLVNIGDGYHGRMQFKTCVIYYTTSVSHEDVLRFGEFLDGMRITTEAHEAVRVTKNGDTYEIRTSVPKAIKGMEKVRSDMQKLHVDRAKLLCSDFSRVAFRGANVRVIVCDDNWNTISAVAPQKQ